MRLFRSISYAELRDILKCGLLRPGPPSFQGKWLAETVEHAVEWGRGLYPDASFHLIEVEIDETVSETLFRLVNLDGIGPARFAEIADLPGIVFIGQVPIPPSTL